MSGPSAAVSATASAPRLAQNRDRGTIAVILFQNAPLFESSIPLTVFGVDRRGQGLPYYRLLACMGEAGPLPTTGGILMATPYGLAAADAAGTLIVPAWRAPAERPPEPALATLRRAAKEGARVVGLDLGVFVLAAAGLLDDRSATTHWMYAPTLSRRHPRIRVQPRELCVDMGQYITGAGAAAGFDACLHIVRRDHGAQSAASLARRLVFPIGRRGGQAPYFDAELPEELLGDPIAEAMAWALDHLTEPFDVDMMAERASLSRRSFDRRFRSATGSAPLQWLNAQRVMYAQRMLESTDLPMDQVALRSGFGSLVAMRGHFRRHLSTSPTAYRQAFRGVLAGDESAQQEQQQQQEQQRQQQQQQQRSVQPSLDAQSAEHQQSPAGFNARDGA
ncbi:helix-turn-helix domain-containing protein [Actinocrinis puniceicyclus]|uniref:Helix-turn-helix domain-containing protein n=1 Tax=Actinocrinis puniceicyclus TaxID=977794 RepID=A0A8J7WU74_9ACTN|nr:helix-turn-helix domain-containing protein [Actinocrinis puniceicyclus]